MPDTPLAAPVGTKALLARLRRHYIKPGDFPGGIFVPECGVNGGRQSRADALYVGFTSTSGRRLVGHELKVSRADWRRELDQAGKADLWADNCHQWIIVAPGPEIVPREEVPHGWGLMYPSARTTTRMQVVVPPVDTERDPSWEVTRSIMARLDTLQHQDRHAWEQETREKIRVQAHEDARRTVEREQKAALTPEQRNRLQQLDQIEHLLGEPLAGFWGDEGLTAPLAVSALRVARATKGLQLDRRWFPGSVERELLGLAEQLQSTATELADAYAELRAIVGEKAR